MPSILDELKLASPPNANVHVPITPGNRQDAYELFLFLIRRDAKEGRVYLSVAFGAKYVLAYEGDCSMFKNKHFYTPALQGLDVLALGLD